MELAISPDQPLKNVALELLIGLLNLAAHNREFRTHIVLPRLDELFVSLTSAVTKEGFSTSKWDRLVTSLAAVLKETKFKQSILEQV